MKILPKNRITGLIQYEYGNDEYYFLAYHAYFDWDYNSVEIFSWKITNFKEFTSSIFYFDSKSTKRIGEKIDFSE